jgi:CRP/FNR family transcriptional regulator
MSGHIESPRLFIRELKNIPFFSTLGQERLVRLADQARRHVFQAGETVFLEGEASRGLFWVQSGWLKAVKYSTSGREQVLHLIEAGQTFNEVGAFTSLPNPASVVALELAHVWLIPREAIRRLIHEDATFAQHIIDVLAERLRQSVALVEDLSLRPVTSRLARLILEEADGDTLLRPRWYTQNELAARLGTVTDVVQRALRELETDELIAVDRQHIRILNRGDLERLTS